MLASFTAAAVAFAAVANAQFSGDTAPTTPANATALAYSKAQYDAAGFNTPLENSQSFNISLNPQALLGVSYETGSFVTDGQALTADQVASKPYFVVYPGSNGSQFENANFTLMLADASAIGMPDSEGDYRHYLANNVHAPANWTSSDILFVPTNGTVITSYAGPGPLVNTGVHRYAWLLFQQPSNFTAPEGLREPGVAPSHWSVNSYVQQSGLGELVAATYFTVVNTENNVPTVAISSVNPATISVASSTASSGAAGPASSGVGSNANNKPSNTGAASTSFAVSSGLLVAVAGLFFTLV